ncbi:MAG: DUF6138 family protein [Coprobacillaceae bacterium]
MTAYYFEGGKEASYDESENSRGVVNCTILQEKKEAYKKVIDFLCEVGEAGFPLRCDFCIDNDISNDEEYKILLSSVYKKYADDIVRFYYEDAAFWARCMQFDLYEEMRSYVKLSSTKVNYVSDSDDDSVCRRPDYYAMAALSMNDDTGQDFANLFSLYAKTIDFTVAIGVEELITAYLNTYKITDKNVKNLVRVIHPSGYLEYQVYLQFDDYIMDFSDEEANQIKQSLMKSGLQLGIDMTDFKELLDEG